MNKLKLSGLAGRSGHCWKSEKSGYCSLVSHSSLSCFGPSSFIILNFIFSRYLAEKACIKFPVAFLDRTQMQLDHLNTDFSLTPIYKFSAGVAYAPEDSRSFQ